MTVVHPIVQSWAIKTKTPCIHNSTIWPSTYITGLVKSLTRIRPRRTPVALFITITGTLWTLHKGQYHELWLFRSWYRWFWCLVPPSGQLLHTSLTCCCQSFWHVSSQSRVTFNCQKNLQQTPTGLTSERLAWGPKSAMTNSIMPESHGWNWYI